MAYVFLDRPGRPPLMNEADEKRLRGKYPHIKTHRQLSTLYHAEQAAKMLRGKNKELREYFLNESGEIRNTLIAAQLGMALRDHGPEVALKFAAWIMSEGENEAAKAENLLGIVSKHRRRLWDIMY